MSITTIVLTNRRDKYLPTMLDSFHKHVTGWDDLIFVDDSGNRFWREQLAADTGRLVWSPSPSPAGYAEAMRNVWTVAKPAAAPVFFVEEDWVFLDDVDLRDLAKMLEADPNMAQVRLARAPYFRREKRYGVANTWWPSMWTCNPSLIAPTTFATDWPDCEWSEQRFGELLLERGATFGVYGDESEPLVEHIGVERATTSEGY